MTKNLFSLPGKEGLMYASRGGARCFLSFKAEEQQKDYCSGHLISLVIILIRLLI